MKFPFFNKSAKKQVEAPTPVEAPPAFLLGREDGFAETPRAFGETGTPAQVAAYLLKLNQEHNAHYAIIQNRTGSDEDIGNAHIRARALDKERREIMDGAYAARSAGQPENLAAACGAFENVSHALTHYYSAEHKKPFEDLSAKDVGAIIAAMDPALGKKTLASLLDVVPRAMAINVVLGCGEDVFKSAIMEVAEDKKEALLDRWMQTALHAKSYDALDLFAKAGANIAYKDNWLLKYAAGLRDFDAAKKLCTLGADIDRAIASTAHFDTEHTLEKYRRAIKGEDKESLVAKIDTLTQTVRELTEKVEKLTQQEPQKPKPPQH